MLAEMTDNRGNISQRDIFTLGELPRRFSGFPAESLPLFPQVFLPDVSGESGRGTEGRGGGQHGRGRRRLPTRTGRTALSLSVSARNPRLRHRSGTIGRTDRDPLTNFPMNLSGFEKIAVSCDYNSAGGCRCRWVGQSTPRSIKLSTKIPPLSCLLKLAETSARCFWN